MDYKTFKSKWYNKGVDVDGYYGYQCWDSFAQWCKENGVPVINTTPVSQGGSGYAKDLWEKKAFNGILKYYDEVPINQLKEGDVAIFKEVQGWTPLSHVAMFDRDIDGQYGYFLGQTKVGLEECTTCVDFHILLCTLQLSELRKLTTIKEEIRLCHYQLKILMVKFIQD